MFSALRSTAVLAPQLALPSSWSSVRTYIANFWNRPTRYPYVGHTHINERHFMHRKLKIIIKPKTNVSDIKRQRKFGFNTRMKTATGRQLIMDKMLEGETFLAEY